MPGTAGASVASAKLEALSNSAVAYRQLGDRRQRHHELGHRHHRYSRGQCLIGTFRVGRSCPEAGPAHLRALQMQMTRRDEVVSKGSGAASLGNPLNTMAWLAGELARRKRPLRAGDIVLSGALVQLTARNPGDAFEATITGLGRSPLGSP